MEENAVNPYVLTAAVAAMFVAVAVASNAENSCKGKAGSQSARDVGRSHTVTKAKPK